MGQGSHVFNDLDDQTGTLQTGDRTFAAEPGPLTFTSISFTPNFEARSAHVSAARCAANGVLLRLPT